MCLFKCKKYILKKLLKYISRLENKLYREVYLRPRRYCKCELTSGAGLPPHKDQYKWVIMVMV